MVYGDIDSFEKELIVFSKILNCLDEVNAKSSYFDLNKLTDYSEYRCTCDNCEQFDRNNYNEFKTIEFDPKRDLKVEENIRKIRINHIRELFSNIIINPTLGKYKIYYIKYPENMNINAQNALLKILEEPPQYAIILLAGKSIDNLLPTIKSRCTKLYIFNETKEFCQLLKEDFEGRENPFSLFYKDILNLDKYRFYKKYKEKFTRNTYKKDLAYIEEALYCFIDSNKKYAKLYEIFLEINKRIERNCNFEMLTDFFLFKSWDIMN